MKTLTSLAFALAMLTVPALTMTAHAATPPACTVMGPNAPDCVTASVNTNSGVTGFCHCVMGVEHCKHPTT